MSPPNITPGVSSLRLFVIERRHRLGVRQVDLAERCGISHSWVTSFECGRKNGKPRKDTLLQLARGLCLPGETPGLVLAFLEAALSGQLDESAIQGVATGAMDASALMTEATQKGQAFKFKSFDSVEASAKLFHSDDYRFHRLEKALALIQEDLPPQDFVIASAMLRRLYELPPQQAQEAPCSRSAPRRRSNWSNWT